MFFFLVFLQIYSHLLGFLSFEVIFDLAIAYFFISMKNRMCFLCSANTRVVLSSDTWKGVAVLSCIWKKWLNLRIAKCFWNHT